MSYMSRIALRRGVPLTRLARLATADAYGDHEMIWRLFSDQPERARDFLFRRMDQGRQTWYLAVSQRRPRTTDELWMVETKPFAPQLRQGQRLVFSLRANPVVSRRTEDGKLKRHDVVMDARRGLDERSSSEGGSAGRYELAQEAGLAWLEARASRNGFALIPGSVQASAYRQHRLLRRSRRPIRFSTLDLDGALKVIDPERLTTALRQGIGPAKGFGCGLLLIRPA
jgi:CRISPR system Cascade subunit CasE